MANKTRRQRVMAEFPPGEARPKNVCLFRHHMIATAQTLALAGITSNAELASRFGVSVSTIGNWKRDFPAFRNAIEAGALGLTEELTDRMLLFSRDGSESATKFLLQSRVPTFQPSAKLDIQGRVEGLGEMLARRVSEDDLRKAGVLIDDDDDENSS